MKVNKIKEKEIIDIICTNFSTKKNVVVGAGKDDCAVIDLGKWYLIITTDMLHKKADFPDRMNPYQIGWMTVACNLSDIASMGATPFSFVVAIGIPDDTDTDFLKWLGEGMEACTSKYGVSIVGGDVDRHDELTLVGTAIGKVDKSRLVRREGAKVGDLLCVTGNLGSAQAGLRIALGKNSALKTLKTSKNVEEILLGALFEPEPRVREGIELSKFATSMTDISDSLATSAHDIASQGKTGFNILEKQIPIIDEVKSISKNKKDLRELFLYGGGDFELLFTINPEDLDVASKKISFSVIGKAVSNGVYLDDPKEKVDFRGYRHF